MFKKWWDKSRQLIYLFIDFWQMLETCNTWWFLLGTVRILLYSWKTIRTYPKWRLQLRLRLLLRVLLRTFHASTHNDAATKTGCTFTNWVFYPFAGDSLAFHNNFDFTTNDYDRDGASGGNCAVWLNGGWWYGYCHRSALNGNYLVGGGVSEADQGLQWMAWKGNEYSLKETEMKIRPLTS